MLADRIIIVAAFLPFSFAVFILGGWPFLLFMLVFTVMAAREYARLFEPLGFHPSSLILILGVSALVLSRYNSGFVHSPQILSLVVLLTMTYHLFSYERGNERAGTNFGIAIGGILYIGWLGAYFISLRALPDGMWWLFVVLPSIWVADSTAYLVGSRWGRHQLAPRLSPKKTWEGYCGGIAGGVIFGMLAGLAIEQVAPAWSAVNLWRGGLIGLLMGVFPTLGDLGESMIKRQAHAKDSGDMIPGHGGFFDRIDSWLWAAVIAYYTIVWFF